MRSGYKVYYYLSSSGENPVKKFLDSLEEKQQEKIVRIFQYIHKYGLVSVIPHTKKLTGTNLWEIRILGRDNIRILYVVPVNKIVLVLHGFIKKKQKTPRNEINTAIIRFEDWKKRSGIVDK